MKSSDSTINTKRIKKEEEKVKQAADSPAPRKSIRLLSLKHHGRPAWTTGNILLPGVFMVAMPRGYGHMSRSILVFVGEKVRPVGFLKGQTIYHLRKRSSCYPSNKHAKRKEERALQTLFTTVYSIVNARNPFTYVSLAATRVSVPKITFWEKMFTNHPLFRDSRLSWLQSNYVHQNRRFHVHISRDFFEFILEKTETDRRGCSLTHRSKQDTCFWDQTILGKSENR